jgi:hypothetical protein
MKVTVYTNEPNNPMSIGSELFRGHLGPLFIDIFSCHTF